MLALSIIGEYLIRIFQEVKARPSYIVGRILEKNLLKYIKGNRNYCTSIYFLLTSNKFSAFHKVNQDEIWHFYKGSTLKLHLISSDGKYSSVLIGSNFKKRRSISVYCS